jgi:mycothiol synthase
MTFTLRPYDPGLDWDNLVDLLVASHVAGLADSEFRTTELRGLLSRTGFDVNQLTRVASDSDGRLVAFGVLWRGNVLGMLLHPVATSHVPPMMLEWARTTVATIGEHNLVNVVARDDNPGLRAMLDEQGFKIVNRELRMTRDLTLPIPPPLVPAGYTVRPLAGENELAAWVALYNHAFGDTTIPGPTSIERWRARLRDPDYDPDLNLVVADRHGDIVAMCHCSIPPLEAARLPVPQGRTEPIATHPLHRRIGLARAAILTGLELLRSRGMRSALLTTDAGNHSAHRLYESIGYRLAYSALWYQLKI